MRTVGTSQTRAFDAALVLERYPTPVARAYGALADCPTALERLLALRDLFEVSLKFCAVVMLKDYLRLELAAPPVNSVVAYNLTRPQLGTWNHVLREAARSCQPQRERLFVPELVDFYFDASGSPRRRGHDLVEKLIKFRNRTIAHRARPHAAEAQQAFEETLPLVEDFLADLSFLADYPLIASFGAGRSELLAGREPRAAAAPFLSATVASPAEPGLYLAREGDLLPLAPFLLCEECGGGDGAGGAKAGGAEAVRVFFYNGGDRRPEFLDYSTNLARVVTGAAAALREIVSGCRKGLDFEIETGPHLVSSEIMREKVLSFVGRTSEEEAVLRFVASEERGYVTVVGDPGIGKSALLSRVVLDLTEEGEAEERSQEIRDLCAELRQVGLAVAFHVCTGRSKRTTDVPQILSSLTDQLIQEYGPGSSAPAKRSLETLLDVARAARTHYRTKALLVIDGVDEALAAAGATPQEHELILRSLPLEERLPDGVFVLASARRGVLDEPPPPSRRLSLTGLSRNDVREMLGEAEGIAARVEESHVDAVRRVSESNPLYVRMLVNDFKLGNLTLDRLDRLPRGLEGYFEDFVSRLSVDARWPVLRDCLLLLASARGHLSAKQVAAMSGTEWAAVVDALEGRLQPVLVADPLSAGEARYQLFHEKFREFVLGLFAGKLPAEVYARLDKHFVREAPTALRGEGEVAAPAHLERARGCLLDHCRRWREAADDTYPLKYLPQHLNEAGAFAELESLLLSTDFLEVKVRRLEDPFLAAEDVQHLALWLLESGRDGDVVDLAVTERPYRRDGVAAALRLAGPRRVAQVRGIVRELLARYSTRPSPLAQAAERFVTRLPFKRRLPAPIINARRVAVEIAYRLGLEDELEQAARDSSATVRTLLVPYLHRLWEKNPEAGWRMLDRLSARIVHTWGLPDGQMIEVYGGTCMAILIYHSHEPDVRGRLRAHWNSSVRRVLHLPEGAGQRRTFLVRALLRTSIFALTKMLRLLMAAQPAFQPINLREMAASYARPGEEQRRGLFVLSHLEHPERGFEPVVELLLDKKVPFGVYLMMVLERTLVFHGARDPAGMLEALLRVHRDGCRWFRQSGLYVAFHTLNMAEQAEDEWLEIYARMTRETVSASRATFSTQRRRYDLLPHMAWPEMVFDKHRPQGRALFIPEFYAQAKARGNRRYMRRVIGACGILSLAYGRHALALDALRPALSERDPKLRRAVVEVLANIRFQDEEAVERFLEREDAGEVRRLLVRRAPALKSNDLFGWIDEYMNVAMIRSDEFRAEIVGAFKRAGHARSLSELLEQILKWVINVSLSEELVPLEAPRAE